MFRRATVSMLAIFLILAAMGIALAGVEGNERKGKYLFRKSCRTCHTEGAQARDLSPLTFTQAQWEASFNPDKVDGYPCKDEWAKLSEKDLKDVYAYLYNHAADSPAPAKCN